MTHSSILVWRTPWTEEPGGYSPWVAKSRMGLSDLAQHTAPCLRLGKFGARIAKAQGAWEGTAPAWAQDQGLSTGAWAAAEAQLGGRVGDLLLPPVFAALPGSQRRGGHLPPQGSWGFQVAQMVKPLSAMQETRVQSLGWEDPKESDTTEQLHFPQGSAFLPMSLGGAELLAAPLSDLKALRVGSGPSIHRALMAESPQAGSKGLGAPVVGDARSPPAQPNGVMGPPTPPGANQGTHSPGRPLGGLHYDLGASGAGLGVPGRGTHEPASGHPEQGR